jgi:hypothetical protein
MRARVLATALSAVMLLSAAAATAGPWLPRPGEFYSEIAGSRWVADRVLDGGGERVIVPGDFQIEHRALSSYNEIGWKDHFSWVLGIPFESRTHRLGRPTFGERTSTGLGDMLVGLRWGILSGATPLSIEADWHAPLGYDRQARPALGDGQQKVGGLLHFGGSLPSGFFELAGGARFLVEDSETQVLGRAVGAIWLGDHLAIAAEYNGAFADSVSRHVAGPEVVLRVDDRMDVFAGSRHTIAGENVVDEHAFHFGIAFRKTGLSRRQGFLGGVTRP